MATSSVLLDPVGWQTGTTGAAARFSRWPSSEEVLPVRRTLTILVLATAAALLAAGCAGDDGGVGIADFAFAPRTITAKVGHTVKWAHQNAGVTHTVTALDKAFDSGDLEEGEEFSHRFPAAGTFTYRCTIHTDMRGTVKVGG
jgi:plastocyanin